MRGIARHAESSPGVERGPGSVGIQSPRCSFATEGVRDFGIDQVGGVGCSVASARRAGPALSRAARAAEASTTITARLVRRPRRRRSRRYRHRGRAAPRAAQGCPPGATPRPAPAPPRRTPKWMRRRSPRTTKAPPCGAFARCAEEDSNLHPVIPDQALNLVTRVSDTSESRQIVRSVRESGRCGRIGRCGCCRRCCHERATSHDREVAPCPVGAVTDRGLDALAASPGGCRGRLTVSDRRRPRLRNPGSASNRPNRGPR